MSRELFDASHLRLQSFKLSVDLLFSSGFTCVQFRVGSLDSGVQRTLKS